MKKTIITLTFTLLSIISISAQTNAIYGTNKFTSSDETWVLIVTDVFINCDDVSIHQLELDFGNYIQANYSKLIKGATHEVGESVFTEFDYDSKQALSDAKRERMEKIAKFKSDMEYQKWKYKVIIISKDNFDFYLNCN